MSATSEPAKVAGYISNCVREGPAKARLCITVAGPQPMCGVASGNTIGGVCLEKKFIVLKIAF